ncbi:unnamed protein product [Discosporangium mesarthrocarpum]
MKGDGDIGESLGCEPGSEDLLPAFYGLDPSELFPLTFVRLPSEIVCPPAEGRPDREESEGNAQEKFLRQLGRDLNVALGEGGEGLTSQLVEATAKLTAADWTMCFERYIDVQRCQAGHIAKLLDTYISIPFECMVEVVLPRLLAAQGLQQQEGCEEYTNTDRADMMDLCRTIARVAAGRGVGPQVFRERLLACALRSFGQLGEEAEITLAEAFFYQS